MNAVKTLLLMRRSLERWSRECLQASEVPQLDNNDWNNLSVYVNVLEPFVRTSKALGGEKYPTSTLVIPMLDEVGVWRNIVFSSFSTTSF